MAQISGDHARSTLAAARELDRRFIGIELDPDHHRTAHLRLDSLRAALA